MADMSVIAGAISSLKAANDIAKGMLTLRDGAAIQSKVIELQSVILSAQSGALAAQSSQMELLERIRDLEKNLSRDGEWAEEAGRYELRDLGGNVFAYILKAPQTSAEPFHMICADCFQRKQKSILQFKFKTDTAQEVYACHSCKCEVKIGTYRAPEPLPRIGRRSTGWEDL